MAALKTHIALRVTNLDNSISFYRALFGVEPVKHKDNYAKFDLDNPALNLTLNVTTDGFSKGALSHLGIQIDSSAAVQAALNRLQAAGLTTREEYDTDCCYALQDKVWVTDPDSNAWEIFVVKVAETGSATAACESNTSVKRTCCAESAIQ